MSLVTVPRSSGWFARVASWSLLFCLFSPTAMLGCWALLCASPASAQQKYYYASVGAAYQHFHADDYFSGHCGAEPVVTTNDHLVFFGAARLGYVKTLMPTFPLVLKPDGSWIPATVSVVGENTFFAFGKSTYTSTLASNGVVTTFETGSWTIKYTTGDAAIDTGTTSSTETLDLNTGSYKLSGTIDEQQTDSTNCGGTFSQHVIEKYVATLPISLSLYTPPGLLAVVNPLAPYILFFPSAPGSVAPEDAVNSPAAAGLAADGQSAIVLVFSTTDKTNPVTFNLAAPSGFAVPQYGSLAQYDPTYLSNPSAPVGNTQLTVNPNSVGSFCDPSGRCYFLALLWAPASMPVSASDLAAGTFHNVALNVIVTQRAFTYPPGRVILQPPPLLLVHGVWSSAEEAWPGSITRKPLPSDSSFYSWLSAGNYPHHVISAVDYGKYSSKAFTDPSVQGIFLRTLADALALDAAKGVAARSVDVVGHSMGGLVTRYFLDNGPPIPAPYLTAKPVHELITIGTPHNGSPFAVTLWNNQNVGPNPAVVNPVVRILCSALAPPCTLGNVFSAQRKIVDGAVQSLETGLPYTSSKYTYNAIVGIHPAVSVTQLELNVLINTFLTGNTVDSILGSGNDTIVPAGSQLGNPLYTTTVNGIVHTALVDSPLDIGETRSSAVWRQALYWLMGGTGQYTPPAGSSSSTSSSSARRSEVLPAGSTTSNPPVLDLTGYTQVPASTVSLDPPTNSTLTVNSLTNITATSSTKTLTELLLFQIAADPNDTPLLYSTQSPFSIAFTPARMGTANFVAFAVFSDMTYATTTLQYTLQPSGSPLDLNLVDAPLASLLLGSSAAVGAQALFSNGPIDVTQLATYQARSGTSAVFSVAPGGTITATGLGTDWLDVSYNGLIASARIAVGSCNYSLGPTNHIVGFTGGSVTVEVTAAAGCAWVANGGDTWLTLANASGKGNGAIALTATPNTSGSTRTAIVSIADRNVATTQLATACTYTVTPTQINAPASGVSGTLAVTTSCPIVAASDADWVVPVSLSASVDYTVAPNSGASSRSATLMVGTQAILVTQGAGVAPDATPPVTTASATPGPNANGWNNTDVTITLNSTDNEQGGTGVKQIAYSTSGAQNVANAVVPGPSTSFTINTEGITTITFFGTDNAGNLETAKTLTVKLDKTPPSIVGSRTPGPNANGWNNTNVTVSFQCTDSLSGLAAGSPPAPTVLSTEGAGQSVNGACQDLAGNSSAATLSGINVDKTPPNIVGSSMPAPNANGWNNTNVTVSFQCNDGLSGLAAGSPPVPTVLSMEGAGQSVSGACQDLAGNSSAATLNGINIDKTPPEAFNQFDPVTKDVALFGRDSLSGVVPGPVQPLSVVSLARDKDGDDDDDRGNRHDDDDLKVELRTYQVFDLAGNSLLLVEKVKKQGRHISVFMKSLQYGQGSVVSLTRNRQKFEWELAEDSSLKELDEELTIDAGSDEQRVEADFHARANETIVVHEEPEPKTKLIKPGLDLLRMATAAGKLSIEF